MMKRFAVALVVLILVGFTAFAGYEVGTGRWSAPWLARNGTLQVLIQDSPFQGNWSHVNITFTSVEVHQADAGNDSGWYPVPLNSGGTIDLVTLKNLSQLLGQTSLPQGKYTQIRIVVDGVQGVMTNGTTASIAVPSNVVRIDQPFNVTAGGITKITLDISRENIHWEAQGWILSPIVGSVKVEG